MKITFIGATGIVGGEVVADATRFPNKWALKLGKSY